MRPGCIKRWCCIMTALMVLGISYVDFCCAAEFNSQLMPRITERLNEFMMVPVNAVKTFVRYHDIGGFEHNATAADRREIYKYMTAQMFQTHSIGYQMTLAISLDDGSVIGFGNTMEEGFYREPGNSGYESGNIEKNDVNYKHWISCFNVNTGDLENCSMTEGTPYIECVDGCKLIPCQMEVSNTSIDSTINDTIWCRNYVVKKVLEGEHRGYVPIVEMCINPKGEIEQDPEKIESDFFHESVNDCYNVDWEIFGKIEVVGDFAVCGESGAVCDLAYRGAHHQQEYDPRYRPFFSTIKQKQIPVWLGPLLLASGQSLYIAYYHPIYYDVGYGSIANGKVFKGVVGGRYDITIISDYLMQQYSDTYMQVMIVESSDPYNVIALSNKDGSAAMKAVLIEDETQPCPNTFSKLAKLDTSLCILVRVPVSDLKESDFGSDRLFHRAFTAYQEMNFPTKSTINVKVSDTIGSAAYVMQGDMYQLPDSNTSWHVLALLPMERDSNDAAMPGDKTFILVCFVGILGFVGCLTLFITFYNKRNERAMVQADWRFTCAFIFGCSMLNLSSLAMLGENTDQLCMLRMWSFNGLFSCALSPLFVKVWRMSTLLKAGSRYKRKKVTNCAAFLYTFPLIVTELLLLLIVSLVDPPQQTEKLGVGYDVGVQQISCEHDSNAFFITQIIFDGFLVVLGCILAYRTKDIDPKYGEAKQLAFSMYNIAFTGMFVLATIYFVELNRLSRIILIAVGVFWASFFSSVAFVLPRLLEVANESSSKRLNDGIRPRSTDFSTIGDARNIEHNRQSEERVISTNTSRHRSMDYKISASEDTNPSAAIDVHAQISIPSHCNSTKNHSNLESKVNNIDSDVLLGDVPLNDPGRHASTQPQCFDVLPQKKDSIFQECWNAPPVVEADSESSPKQIVPGS